MSLRGINHLVLKVRNLAASDRFYRGLLGLEKVGERGRMWFYRAGGHHHDLALIEIGERAAAPHTHQTGLFHFCLDVSDETALAELHERCRRAGAGIYGAVDHTIMRSFYVSDPDGHTVELGVDAPQSEWAALPDPFAADKPYALWKNNMTTNITQLPALLLLIAALTVCVSAQIRTYTEAPPASADRPQPMRLWPGDAPLAKGAEPTDTPTLSLYQPPADKATGASVVVCPGGGYRVLADHEGHAVAVWLNSLGITAAVLKYRLGPKYNHPAMLQDAQRAIRTVRARAAEWKLDPNRIGVLGFSAGGHLASTAATHFDEGNANSDDLIERVSSRPDAAILCYAVITFTEPFLHKGSREHLLGKEPSSELIELLSNEKQVTAKTPPTFLFHTADDAAVPVENSLMFAAACRKNKVPVELHVYETGRHGVGLAQDNPQLKTWPEMLSNWLRARGFLAPQRVSAK